MSNPRTATELRRDVLSKGFTPALREVEALASLLGDADDDVAKGAEAAAVRVGEGVVTPLLSMLGSLGTGGRVSALRVIGRLSPTAAEVARSLIPWLSDADPRVAKATAQALGRLRESEVRGEVASALVAAWDRSPPLPLARAIAEAFGKLGVVAARRRLEAAAGGDAELSRIAKNALERLQRDASRDEESSVDGGRVADFDADLVVLCREGLEDMVAAELAERCPSTAVVRGAAQGTGRVTGSWRGAPNDLFGVRTMLGFAFALAPEVVTTRDDLADACVRALSSEAARRVLETWTSGSVRYRLEWQGMGPSRALTWRVVHAMRERRPSWVNDPSGSPWEISARVDAGKVTVTLVPRGLADPRFAYRLGDVPAASHPTLAAALVGESAPGPDDVVWDPFMGSGTELIERARVGPYRMLIGSDLDLDAVDVARRNAAAAGVDRLILQVADATSHRPAGVTRIITNPPMGRRVARDGSLGDLCDQFTDHAATVLSSGGRLTWLSPLGGRTAARAEANRLRVLCRRVVDMGGFFAELQVWLKA